ncbi:MAG: S4 domain-containing protein YaaA [Bacilli bacterium]|jgi:ribosome-associated protein|nr:S4 domain-containing protein YaaA [Bacilli bacterium]MCH4210387.1 S4 domain-containing protein YaaA [Bacilli bacterium]MCH4277563.1 S4 domain-containing protein YaaA [Bacilli bacterium]MCI2055115.1 S4 domain-containing protein YaaA [Bacilli bacterium]
MAKTSEKTVVETAINSEYITLGQFLKFAGIIDEGGMAKAYLASNEVKVNSVLENRRGRKLRPGDVVILKEGTYKIVSK